MSRNIGKARLKSFHKKVKQIVHEYGGVPEKTKSSFLSYNFNIETKAGLLGISIHEDSDLDHGTSVFSIFARFEVVKKANDLMGENHRLNPYSGKWNFHYGDEGHCLHIFETELRDLITDKPMTDYKQLELLLDKTYEATNKLVVFDEIHEGRLCIDDIKMWSDVHGRTGLVVLCDGSSMNIRKTTPFQLWIKGVEL